jgi:hypothetical protein
LPTTATLFPSQLQSDRRNEEIGADGVLLTKFRLLASGNPDRRLPLIVMFIPPRFFHHCVEASVPGETPFVGDTQEVGEELLLRCVLVCPGRTLFKRERVELGLDITTASRIDIVPPNATKSISLFNNDEVSAVVAADEINGGTYTCFKSAMMCVVATARTIDLKCQLQ